MNKIGIKLRVQSVVLVVMGVVAGLATMGHAAVLMTETFDSNAAGWSDRDGVMTFSHSAGYIQGTFTDPGFPQTDAFRVTTGSFVGDYLAAGAQSLSFEFQALTVAPSDISLRLFSSTEFFFIPLSPTLGTFNPSIPLTYSSSWFGSGGAAEFNQLLQDVTDVQIQFTTSGPDTQIYRLNSFTLSGDQTDPPPGPGGGLSAIPEPGSALFVMGGILLFALRGLTGVSQRTRSRLRLT